MDENEKQRRCLRALKLKTEEIDCDRAKLQTRAVQKAFGILRSTNGVLLADEVGMGKTFEALGLIFSEICYRIKYGKGDRRIPRVLIIVPSGALRKKWRDDYHKFIEKCIRENVPLSHVIRKGTFNVHVPRTKKEFRDLTSRDRVVIASIGSLLDNEFKRNWDIVVVDEAHKFKNRCSRRYALLNESSGNGDNRTLHGRFKKLVLMTATPFQLKPSEMTDLLSLFLSAKWEDQLKREGLRSTLGTIRERLTDYQRSINSFEATWKQIPFSDEAYVEQLCSGNGFDLKEAEKEAGVTSLDGSIGEALSKFREASTAKKNLQPLLKSLIVRNSKTKKYRKPQEGSLVPGVAGSIQLTSDEELFYLLVKKFIHEANKEKRVFNVQVLQETTSSYATLNEYSLMSRRRMQRRVCASGSSAWYLDLLSRSIETLASRGEDRHPKLRELKINLQLRNANQIYKELPHEKTLIFCRFIKTAYVIKEQINEDCRRIIEKSISQRVREAFRKKHPRKSRIDQELGRQNEVWRFSRRFDNLLKRDDKRRNSRIFTLMDSLYAENPELRTKLSDWAQFNYTRQGKPERHNAVIKMELEEVLRSKLKEPDLLYLIMVRFQKKTQDVKLNSKHATQLMKEAVEKIFRDKVFTYLKREFESIKREFSKLTDENLTVRLTRLIDGLRRQDFAEVLSGSTKSVLQERLMEAFNTKFNPQILIVTQIGQEGIDLQKECSRVIHYDLWWNPATMEQRVGRVDRIGSKISREREQYEKKAKAKRDGGPKLEIFTPYIKDTVDEDIYKIAKERERNGSS